LICDAVDLGSNAQKAFVIHPSSECNTGLEVSAQRNSSQSELIEGNQNLASRFMQSAWPEGMNASLKLKSAVFWHETCG
jgi:hypothetical protein